MDAGVSAIVFHPTRSMAVSTSFGGDFKNPDKNILLSVSGATHTVVVTAVALSLDGSVMRTTEVKLPEDGIGGLVSLNFWVNQTTKLSPYPQSFMNLARKLVSRPLPSTLPVPWQLVHPLIWLCNSDKSQNGCGL
ncbi:hypothetical protein Bca4012_075606 [Brassica carinata]|uniref:Uncharacterized protein n=1 Tax=Brassica carinata TaxID=52824 RepID=A0A8X7U8H7_BRACI|nr:hypothetical protein Bca52824_073995 [Brassica carinata]